MIEKLTKAIDWLDYAKLFALSALNLLASVMIFSLLLALVPWEAVLYSVCVTVLFVTFGLIAVNWRANQNAKKIIYQGLTYKDLVSSVRLLADRVKEMENTHEERQAESQDDGNDTARMVARGG